MTSTWTWAQVITSIKGVTARTSGGYSQSNNGKFSIDTTNGAWMYVPSNAYYTTGSWMNIPWNSIKGKLGAATTGEVLKDKTFSSSSGISIKGTIESKTSGNSSVTANGKWGLDNTNGFWIYVPNNAYYTTGHYLNVPWNTCKSKVESMAGVSGTASEVVAKNYNIYKSTSSESYNATSKGVYVVILHNATTNNSWVLTNTITPNPNLLKKEIETTWKVHSKEMIAVYSLDVNQQITWSMTSSDWGDAWVKVIKL